MVEPLLGAHAGDIDSDGNMDFIMGSRYSGPPNAMIFRVEYNGSGAVTDPANWTLTLADSAVSFRYSQVDVEYHRYM